MPAAFCDSEAEDVSWSFAAAFDQSLISTASSEQRMMYNFACGNRACFDRATTLSLQNWAGSCRADSYGRHACMNVSAESNTVYSTKYSATDCHVQADGMMYVGLYLRTCCISSRAQAHTAKGWSDGEINRSWTTRNLWGSLWGLQEACLWSEFKGNPEKCAFPLDISNRLWDALVCVQDMIARLFSKMAEGHTAPSRTPERRPRTAMSRVTGAPQQQAWDTPSHRQFFNILNPGNGLSWGCHDGNLRSAEATMVAIYWDCAPDSRPQECSIAHGGSPRITQNSVFFLYVWFPNLEAVKECRDRAE